MASPVGENFTKFWDSLLDLAEEERQFNDGPIAATGPKLLDACYCILGHLNSPVCIRECILKYTTNQTTSSVKKSECDSTEEVQKLVHILPCRRFQRKTHRDNPHVGKRECQ